MTRHAVALLSAALLSATVTACGASDPQELQVSAAASLQSAFTKYAHEDFPGADIHQSFAGSDQLAAQIRQGARPDVFASANTTYPDQLHAKGLVGGPVVFARNRLVLAVPADSPIHSLAQAARPGVALVIGDPSVPVGSYTRQVLGRLPAAEREALLTDVRSQEPDVSSIVGKLAEGAADGGFVYLTDVRAADHALRAIALPDSLQPQVAYGMAVVSGSSDGDLAHRFVEGLLPGHPGARILQEAGFLPPG